MRYRTILACHVLAFCAVLAPLHADRGCVSGIYPHLAMYNNEGECGTGAVVPWAGKLWVVTYGPHCVRGSSDRLYEIAPDLDRTIRPESIGGTHANRMIHRESGQLFIGYHAIDRDGVVRTIPWSNMPGRLTGIARHLTDPANMIYMATMEEGLYEVDVHTLAVKELIRDGNISNTVGLQLPENALRSSLPGYHGKGLFSGQGRLIYSNNGERGGQAQHNPATISGALAEWSGKGDWQLVRRNQFTEVRGPGDLMGNADPDTDPVWALGWDHRSVLLMLLDKGKWFTYRLPKGSHSYDGAHGWNTEWPRIRDIGETDMLATMHGTFWRFPTTFSRDNSAGIVPRSNYLKVVGDFCRWEHRIVLGCDDSAKSEFLNTRPFKSRHGAAQQSNSNLWFIAPETLDEFGPVLGRGSVWLRENIEAGAVSDPYLFSGYDYRMVHITHATEYEISVNLETDHEGNGQWTALRTVRVPARGSISHIFTPEEKGTWIRARCNGSGEKVTVLFQYRNRDLRTEETDAIFTGIATDETEPVVGGIVRSLGGDNKVLGVVAVDLENEKETGYYQLDENLSLVKVENPEGRASVLASAPSAGTIQIDAASVIVTEEGRRCRLPLRAGYSQPMGDDPSTAPVQPEPEQTNLALGATVAVSSTHQEYAAENAVDGKTDEASRWVSKASGEKWIVLDLGREQTIASAKIITGYLKGPGTAIRNAVLQVERNGAWVEIPGGEIAANHNITIVVNFDEPVTARTVRLLSTDETYVRIYEIGLYGHPRRDVTKPGAITVPRVCREVATERDLLNCGGTFYELPARNAGGLAKIRPVATHRLAVHDYASYRGMLVLTGIDAGALGGSNEHIIVSADRKCAVWCGAIDNLWQLGKPRGEGGPWKNSPTTSGEPSDPYLMTGYDRKTLVLSHASDGPVTITVEVDPDGTDLWCKYHDFVVKPGQPVTHEFPEGFSAYWVRVTVDQATTVTAWFSYR